MMTVWIVMTTSVHRWIVTWREIQGKYSKTVSSCVSKSLDQCDPHMMITMIQIIHLMTSMTRTLMHWDHNFLEKAN